MPKSILEEHLIFLFSLPRSGSTLLQRILASHPKIGTCSEPWLLLPFFYSSKFYGTHAEYSQTLSSQAIQDFISSLPGGEGDYYEALRDFSLSLYTKVLNSGEEFFLEKTPRYFLIIPDIVRTFPKAKFIFLFRNPLHVLSSVISTWMNGRLRIENNYIDLYEGPGLLADGFKQIKDKSVWLDYEDLVKDPTGSLDKICNYLEIESDESILNHFHNKDLFGRMGDPTGVNEYKDIDLRPLEKWKSVLNTGYRKKLAIKYLSHIGSENLQTFGYDLTEMTKEVKQIRSRRGNGLRDRFDFFLCLLFRIFEIPLFRKNRKERTLTNKTFVLHR